MTRLRRWALASIPVVVVGVVAWGFAEFSGMPYVLALGIIIVAVLANGFIATLEDDLPGGFNNPDGSSTPRYAAVLPRLGRFSVIGVVLLMASFFAVAAFTEEGARLPMLTLAAFSLLAAIGLLKRSRWLLWLAAGVVALCAVLAWHAT